MPEQPPTIVVFYARPAVMKKDEAATYLGMGRSQFETMLRLYGDEHLPALNFLPGGVAHWAVEDLDAFIAWRKLVGPEARAS